MKCPICNNEINEEETECPNCGITLKEKIIEREDTPYKEEERKSNFLYYTRIVSIIIALIAAVIAFASEYYVGIAEVIITELILCIALKTFEVIIDLLQSINSKLK